MVNAQTICCYRSKCIKYVSFISNNRFGSIENIEAPTSNIKVYYTDSSIKKVEKASKDKLEEIIINSYLMCGSY